MSLCQDTGRVRQHNRAIILELLRTEGPLSRSALARRGGVSRPTVLEITNDLMRDGLTREVGFGPSTGGRRPLLLELAPESQWSIGVCVGHRTLTGVITDLYANVHLRDEVPFHTREGPSIFMRRVKDVLCHLAQVAPGGWSSVRAIGVSMPAPVLATDPFAIWSPHYPEWEQFQIKDELAAAYAVPVLLDNNANCAALGEHFFGAGGGAQHMLYVLVSRGIGAGLVINGQIYRGAIGGAGEIGHTTIDLTGPLCHCGRHGCLQSYASADGMVRLARQAMMVAGRRDLAGRDRREMSVDDIIDAAQAGDALAIQVLDQAGRYLGIGLANASNLLNPGLIVLGGPAARAGELLLAPAVEVARQQSMPGTAEQVRIVLGQLGEDAEAIGAAVLPLRDLFKIPIPEDLSRPSHRNGHATAKDGAAWVAPWSPGVTAATG